MAPNERLAALSAAGVSIWLDDLSRERLTSGNLQELITDKRVVGVTTNPTIFAAALANGRGLRRAGPRAGRSAARRSTTSSVRSPSTDVREACDVFRSTWEPSGGVDGRVSLEVSPLLARDTDATLAEALDIWKAVDRPNLLVKIPATQEGLPAITSALAEGVSINVTLIFSVERYRDVMTAYLEGLEQAAANGQNLAASPRWPASSSPASTPRSTSGWRRSAPTRRWRCAARPASRTPGWPTPRSRRPSRASGGPRSPRRARSRSGRCGRRPG